MVLGIFFLVFIIWMVRYIYRNYNGWYTSFIHRRMLRLDLREKEEELKIKYGGFAGQEKRADTAQELERLRLLLSSRESTIEQKHLTAQKILELQLMRLQFMSSDLKVEAEKKALRDMEDIITKIQEDPSIDSTF